MGGSEYVLVAKHIASSVLKLHDISINELYDLKEFLLEKSHLFELNTSFFMICYGHITGEINKRHKADKEAVEWSK